MAPRTAKAKKPTTTKVAENDAPKKGRGKAKAVEEPEVDIAETEVGDVAPVIEKKTNKRGKKANGDTNGVEETNEVSEAPPSKKSKKNKIADAPSEEKDAITDDNVAEDEVSNPDEAAEDDVESNGHSDEAPAGKTGKGRKKPTKKESAASKAKTETKTSGRGKKNTKQETESEVMDKDEDSDEKPAPKAAPKGRGRKPAKKADKELEPEVPEEQNESGEEEVKAEPPPTKGRKRGPAKPAKEATPEIEGDDAEDEEPAKEPKKKETKGKKAGGKKGKQAEDEDEVMPAIKKRKFTPKDEKVSDEVKDEEPTDEAVEPKPAKGKRGQKKVEIAADTEEAPEAGDSNRRRRKVDEKVPSEEPKKKAPLKNKATTDYENIDFSNTSKNPHGKEWNLKIASWNVDGIRAWMNKGGLDYIKYEKPDILCLQETKCSKDKLPDEIANLPGYHAYWQGSDSDGYAGVGIYTTKLAISVQYGLQNEELDNEGRIITAEYEQFYLICTYVPNAGRKLVTLPKRLQWNEEFRKHVKALNEKKPVIICGDMNVAHNEIDLSNPKSNKKNAGFTPEERAGMTEFLSDGFVDSYRHLLPEKTGAYTFWTYMMNSRAKNVGWRLDYFLMSERLLPSLCDNVIRSEVYGSDHCPITLFLHITSADKPKE